MNKLFSLIFFACVMFSTLVSAIGVTPARTNVLFEPAKETCSSFTILNIEGVQQSVQLSIGGDLAPYVTMKTRALLFEPLDASRSVELCVTLPALLESGYHSAFVFIVSGVPSTSGQTALSFRTSLIAEMRVLVPYGVPFLENKFFATVRPDGTVSFDASLRNLGKEAVDPVVMTVDVQRESGTSIVHLQADPVAVPALGFGSVSVVWSETVPGEYVALMTLTYRDTSFVQQQPFTVVRDGHVSIMKLRITDYEPGQAVAFEATIRNDGPAELSPVLVEVRVLDEEHNVLASGKSEPLTLTGEEKKKILVYVDASSLVEGQYTATLSLQANDVAYPKKEFSVVLSERASVSPLTGYVASEFSFMPSRTLVVGLGILLLVLVNVWWFWRGRRKKERLYEGIPQPSRGS